MKWILYLEILYFMLVVFTSGRIILDTRSSTKTLAYLFAVFFIPFIGIIIYFTFGVNYKKKQIYSKKILEQRSSSVGRGSNPQPQFRCHCENPSENSRRTNPAISSQLQWQSTYEQQQGGNPKKWRRQV